MKKRLSDADFRQATAALELSDRHLEIAKAALVQGRSQVELAQEFALTKGAVSQIVRRVWEAHQGGERVTVVLPRHQAYIVKKWAKEYEEKKT